ncbi:hypothetical protein B0H13DRAFT_2304177 [Mycena leptocephala]|nr:hypothetical protein B0H13DRAFT_2304177 [Mycena leptocephala]
MRRSTSIHWHGFLQACTSGMDGSSFVNQCPIAPSTTFDYVFILLLGTAIVSGSRDLAVITLQIYLFIRKANTLAFAEHRNINSIKS